MRSRLLGAFGFTLMALCLFTVAQRVAGQSGQARLITQPVDDSKLMVQHGSVYPLARAEFDRGAAPASLPMERMLMVMKRSPAQESAVETFLAQQLDKTSPNYHQWLTPSQFGERFGAADEDIATVTSWLQAHGFQVAGPSYGRGVIEFSGDAGQVEQAFHTSIHSYVVNGQQHYANSTEPSLPAALMPAVEGVLSLYDFPRHPASRRLGAFRKPMNSAKAEALSRNPNFTFPNPCVANSTCLFALGPQDFATIYDVTPLYSAGIDGTGETIAVVADSNINLADVTQFRSVFGLPVKSPNVIIPPGSQNPGLNGDEVEAVLDTEWSGAVAKNATIDLVVSASTNTTFGGDLSAQYIINFNGNKGLAPILSESFGECELFLGSAGNAFYNNLWSQAAGEGITVIVSTGDSGSVSCLLSPPQNPDNPNSFGLGVSGISSTQFDVAVGGTDFNDITNPTTFWNLTNTAGTGGSAKSYIPETTWNDTCTNLDLGSDFGFSTSQETNCNNTAQLNDLITLGAGSGGPSNCTAPTGATNTSPGTCAGGNGKPKWQTVTGVPADGKRDTPDVSLFAATGAFSGSFYIICQADDPNNQNGQPCSLTANNFLDFSGVGGTSVSTQVFAGLMALVDQAAKGAQGNISSTLYGIAATKSCPTASATASCVFHQVSLGTIAQACVTGSLNCTTTNQADALGVLTGFNAAPGYNLATGLGSVDAKNLVTAISNGSVTPPTGSFTVGPASGTATVAAPGDSATYQVTVTGTGGFAGTVDFVCSDPSTGVSCSGPSATLSATTTSATSTLTITTTAATARLVPQRPSGNGIAKHDAARLAGMSLRTLSPRLALVMIMSAGLMLFAIKSRAPRSSALCASVIFGLLLFAGCGGGSSSSGGGGGTGSAGTPTGNSAVTVTASGGGVTSTTTFTLTVN